jgi:hypothetical protein
MDCQSTEEITAINGYDQVTWPGNCEFQGLDPGQCTRRQVVTDWQFSGVRTLSQSVTRECKQEGLRFCLLQDRVCSSYGEAQKIAAINRGLIQVFKHRETWVEALKSKLLSSVALSTHRKKGWCRTEFWEWQEMIHILQYYEYMSVTHSKSRRWVNCYT